jgi:hypothetical protein
MQCNKVLPYLVLLLGRDLTARGQKKPAFSQLGKLRVMVVHAK